MLNHADVMKTLNFGHAKLSTDVVTLSICEQFFVVAKTLQEGWLSPTERASAG